MIGVQSTPKTSSFHMGKYTGVSFPASLNQTIRNLEGYLVCILYIHGIQTIDTSLGIEGRKLFLNSVDYVYQQEIRGNKNGISFDRFKKN